MMGLDEKGQSVGYTLLWISDPWLGCGEKQSFGTRFYLMGIHLSILIRWLLIYEEVPSSAEVEEDK